MIEKDLVDISNPCVKCGSVQCAICSDDLPLLFIEKEKVKEDMESVFNSFANSDKNYDMEDIEVFGEALLEKLGIEEKVRE